ncbi:MAG TPA: MoaD/ThiS family protein [Malonomonas sp.]
MQITVKLSGAFRVGRFKEQVRTYPSGSSIQQVVDSLQLPEQILGIVLINGVHADFTDLLHDGDTLTILPIVDGG